MELLVEQRAVEDGPRTQRYVFWEGSEVAGEIVEFRLTYRGRLPAASNTDTRAKDKHLIRRQIHRQLRVLWEDHTALKSKTLPKSGSVRSEVEEIADNFARNGYRFVPLVRKSAGLACSLNILFLRRDNPGNLVKSGGDIDNRLKVLLDALRMPVSLQELGGFARQEGEDPFFCLLEDDVLISDISVTTDRLLTPREDPENINDVMLVIHVVAKAITWGALITYGF
jgi:hypothetical protein